MTHDELSDMLRKDLAEILDIDPSEITDKSDLLDLDIDSIDIVEVVGHAEGRLGIEITEQSFHDIERFEQLVSMIEEAVSRKT